MSELTLEQRKAIAIASARLRAKEKFPDLDPRSELSGTDKFLAGVGKGMTDVVRGAGQMVGLGPTAEETKETRRLDAPLMDSGAGMAGNLVGNVAVAAPTAFIPGANTLTGAALIGGGLGAMQPVESGTERAMNAGVGAVLSPLTLAGGRSIVRAGRAVKAAADPMTEAGQARIIGDLLRRSAGENADDAMRAMQGAQPLLPGSQPTAAQVAGSGGIAALERAATQANPEAYAARGVEQNIARLNALRAIAGNDAQMQAAVTAREAAAGPLYQAAREQGIDPAMAKAMQPQIQNLMERMPSGALERAKEIARVQGESFTDAGSISGLHSVKKAIDDMLSNTADNGMGTISRRGLQQFQGDLLSTMDELSPLYAQGRQAFAEKSAPINQMEVGRALLNKLEPALTQGNLPVRMNAESFARALRDGDALAQHATGFKGATLAGTMSPEQMATLNALRDDLARSATAQNLGRGVGSNTFQNLSQENLMNAAGISSLPQLLSRPVQMTNYALRSVYSSANEEMKQRLAQALLNPQETAALMQTAIPSARAQAIANALRRAEPYVPAAGALPVMMQQ